MTHSPRFVRSAFNYDVKEASDSAAYHETMESLTVQSMSEDADINVIVQRFGITGKFPENPRVPSYGDFSGVTDFRSAIEAIREAEAKFMEYPADFRARFDNDPQKLLMFVEDPRNIEEARRLKIPHLFKESVYVDGAGGKTDSAGAGGPGGQGGQAGAGRQGSAAGGGGSGGAQSGSA